MAIAVSSAFARPPWTFRVAAPRRVARSDFELTRSTREFVLTKAEVLDIVFYWQNLFPCASGQAGWRDRGCLKRYDHNRNVRWERRGNFLFESAVTL